MIRRYAPIAPYLAGMQLDQDGGWVDHQDFQALVQLMKEYIVCNYSAVYDSAADEAEDEAILNKIEQLLGKGWDK